MSCIFCDIIAGAAPAALVYEDEATLAGIDLRQSNPGHVLVIPKRHVETLHHLPHDLHAPLMNAVVIMTRAVQACFHQDGINIWQSNGPGANQEVPHVHFHVFPRWTGDRHFQIYPSEPTDMPLTEREQLAVRLRPFVERR